jgi:hypothetical protein
MPEAKGGKGVQTLNISELSHYEEAYEIFGD